MKNPVTNPFENVVSPRPPTISVVAMVGDTPVIGIADTGSLRDAFELDKWVFEQNPTWKYFMRRCLPREFPPGRLPRISEAEAFYIIVNRTSPRIRLKLVFIRAAKAEFGAADEATLAAAKREFAARAAMVAPALNEVPYE